MLSILIFCHGKSAVSTHAKWVERRVCVVVACGERGVYAVVACWKKSTPVIRVLNRKRLLLWLLLLLAQGMVCVTRSSTHHRVLCAEHTSRLHTAKMSYLREPTAKRQQCCICLTFVQHRRRRDAKLHEEHDTRKPNKSDRNKPTGQFHEEAAHWNRSTRQHPNNDKGRTSLHLLRMAGQTTHNVAGGGNGGMKQLRVNRIS